MHHNRQAWAGVESPLKPTISVNVDDFETDEYIDDENGGGQGTTNANSFSLPQGWVEVHLTNNLNANEKKNRRRRHE